MRLCKNYCVLGQAEHLQEGFARVDSGTNECHLLTVISKMNAIKTLVISTLSYGKLVGLGTRSPYLRNFQGVLAKPSRKMECFSHFWSFPDFSGQINRTLIPILSKG